MNADERTVHAAVYHFDSAACSPATLDRIARFVEMPLSKVSSIMDRLIQDHHIRKEVHEDREVYRILIAWPPRFNKDHHDLINYALDRLANHFCEICSGRYNTEEIDAARAALAELNGEPKGRVADCEIDGITPGVVFRGGLQIDIEKIRITRRHGGLIEIRPIK